MTSVCDYSTEDELLAWAAREWELSSSPQELSRHLKACMTEVQRAQQAIDQALDSKRARAGLRAAKDREERALKARSSTWMHPPLKPSAELQQGALLWTGRTCPGFLEVLFNRMGQMLSETGHDISRWQQLVQESLLLGCDSSQVGPCRD
jgi:hypothetical protein